MHSRLEKPIIREERAETSLVAFIEFGFSIARSHKWETQERDFEEEGLFFNLNLKRGSLRKYKDYSWAFENDEKMHIFSMKADFKSDFSTSSFVSIFVCFREIIAGSDIDEGCNYIQHVI